MQRSLFLFAYFFVCANCLSQVYPFVHYTPKDGLISNQIKGIYQDSKGRLFFTSVNGLSIYDGSRFINYNSKNGLGYDMVNCVMEMAPDSIWVVTNSEKINCLVNGKMKLLSFKNEHVINSLCRDEKQDIYAAAEDGLLLFDKKEGFIKLPFLDLHGNDASAYIYSIVCSGNYLLVQRDPSLLPGHLNILYLYDKRTRKVVSEIPGVYVVQIAPDGRTWISTETGIMAIDTAEMKNGKLLVQELPESFASLRNKGKFLLFFDEGNNCWLGNQSNLLLKASPPGAITTFSSSSGLSMFYINSVFQDREGITWISTNNAGVNKLVHNNFSHFEKPFDIINPSDISNNHLQENLLIFSASAHTAAIVHNNEKTYLHLKNPVELSKLAETPYGLFGVNRNTLYKLDRQKNLLYPKAILSDSSEYIFPNLMMDRSGNILVAGKYHLYAIIRGNNIFKTPLPYFADFPAQDNEGNIWVATRDHDLIMYKTHPEDPRQYLEQKLFFKKELTGISPRSIIIDQMDNIWIGTRNHGIQVFYLDNGSLVKKIVVTTASGLSDNFTTHLSCDRQNNIWASSALGLDKITLRNGTPLIENITRQNNMYQSVFSTVSDQENNVWGQVSNGVIRITPEKERPAGYTPTLLLSQIKAGKDTIIPGTLLSHTQNNLSFNFSATSFLDEKQTMYSYRLLGGSNNLWSEPSNNTTVSFIDLNPGEYRLDIKAVFPAGRYPETSISYAFSIKHPWWQTRWFRTGLAILLLGLIITGIRFYYRRKLEKKMAALEKQQAIEKDRTRIATDMHDDLGAGLSRIKFLSETIGIKKQQKQPIEDDITKIREYSHEMIDKMGEIVWALNEKNDTLSDLISYTRAYAAEYLAQNGVQCRVEAPDPFPVAFVSGEFRRNVFLTIKEALHNVVKHAQATEVKLIINLNHHLEICLQDNGVGLDKTKVRPFSNGLDSMKKRINEIGGQFEIENKQGTLIRMTIPL
jgi:signal transduction histidine kinase/ligand-binding sensor domain-containing protein